jgi:hypothetical protein
MEKKSVDPWPPYDSPERVSYPDRWPLPESLHNEIRRRLTPEAVEKISRVLGAPEGFPLVERLRRAVYEYHHLSTDLLCHLEGADKHKALKKIKAPLRALRAALREFPSQYMEELYGDVLRRGNPSPGSDLAAVLADLKNRINKADKPRKPGPPYNHPRNVFFALLLAIYEDATGEKARSTNPETGKPGKAFRFFKTTHNLLLEKTSDETINRFLKPSARKTARDYLSSLRK